MCRAYDDNVQPVCAEFFTVDANALQVESNNVPPTQDFYVKGYSVGKIRLITRLRVCESWKTPYFLTSGSKCCIEVLPVKWFWFCKPLVNNARVAMSWTVQASAPVAVSWQASIGNRLLCSWCDMLAHPAREVHSKHWNGAVKQEAKGIHITNGQSWCRCLHENKQC